MDRPFGRSRINRALMNLTDMAMRTMVRMEASAEFYSVPKIWFLGLSRESFQQDTWSALVSSINAISRDINGDIPELKQVSQHRCNPTRHARTIAMLASAETDIPPEQLGIRLANPTSAEALAAAENQLTRTANRQNRMFSRQLLNAMGMAVQLRDNSPQPPDLTGIRPLWAPTREVSDAARADYYTKVAGVNGDWADSDRGTGQARTHGRRAPIVPRYQQRMKAQRNIDQLKQQRMNPQDTEALMAANPKAPPELQPLLDKAYRDYQTDLDNLRESAADVIENVVDRDPLNVKDAIRDFSRDASQLANEYYDTVRGLWSEYAGVRLDDFDHTRLIDPTAPSGRCRAASTTPTTTA